MEKIRRSEPILIDANIVMFGCAKANDPKYAFSVIRDTLLTPLFSFLSCAQIHEVVYSELPVDRKAYIDSVNGVSRVDTLYSSDPDYNRILNNVADHSEFSYRITHGDWQMESVGRNRADVFLLAYAAYFGVAYLCSNDYGVLRTMQTIPALSTVVPILAAEAVAVAAATHSGDVEKQTRLKAFYKELAAPEIKNNRLPGTLRGYFALRGNRFD